MHIFHVLFCKDNTEVGAKAVKVLRNGQLIILRDGKEYNVMGTLVK